MDHAESHFSGGTATLAACAVLPAKANMALSNAALLAIVVSFIAQSSCRFSPGAKIGQKHPPLPASIAMSLLGRSTKYYEREIEPVLPPIRR